METKRQKDRDRENKHASKAIVTIGWTDEQEWENRGELKLDGFLYVEFSSVNTVFFVPSWMSVLYTHISMDIWVNGEVFVENHHMRVRSSSVTKCFLFSPVLCLGWCAESIITRLLKLMWGSDISLYQLCTFRWYVHIYIYKCVCL